MKTIVKIGTGAIYDSKAEKLKMNIIGSLAENIYDMHKRKHEFMIVSSGAVGCGKKYISGNDSIAVKQAQAAIGQPILMEAYRKAFNQYNLPVAQFLLSYSDLDSYTKLNNLKQTYDNLRRHAIPIVNENDPTAIEELKFGDNDPLAAELLVKFNFDKLVILTEKGALISEGEIIKYGVSFDYQDYDNLDISMNGSGGLESKLKAAKKAVDNNKECIIALAGDNLMQIINGDKICTRFK
ncbi:MAG: hypothetical protein WC781_00890 [Candidatus Pacearchaeota archaeon]|jgi:glutamate 5-kinase